jgi:hypothetical protein
VVRYRIQEIALEGTIIPQPYAGVELFTHALQSARGRVVVGAQACEGGKISAMDVVGEGVRTGPGVEGGDLAIEDEGSDTAGVPLDVCGVSPIRFGLRVAPEVP